MTDSIERETTDLGPDELDYLVFIAINYELNDWETGFCISTIKFLSQRNGRMLSEKQSACLHRMLRKFDTKAEEVGSGFATEDSVEEALIELRANTPKSQQQIRQQQQTDHIKSHFDDYDDDIPF